MSPFNQQKIETIKSGSLAANLLKVNFYAIMKLQTITQEET